MLKRILPLVAVAGFAVACVEEAIDSSEIESFDQALDCQTMTGIYPTKAALAVAMANEMGSWDVSLLAPGDTNCNSYNAHVKISDKGEAICAKTGNCPNTRALLALADPRLNDASKVPSMDQNVFNAVSYCNDLIASLQRQKDFIQNLKNNNTSALPPANYCLLKKADDGTLAACGKYYKYTVGTTNGCEDLPATNGDTCAHAVAYGWCGQSWMKNSQGKDTCALSCGLCTRQCNPVVPGNVDNLVNELCLFGQQGTCGSNPYVAFQSTIDEAWIDPQDGDISGGGTAGGNCITLPGPNVTNQAANLGKCCSYPNPNVTGTVTGTLIDTTANGVVSQRCSLAGSFWSDTPVGANRFVNLACHFTSGTTVMKGKLIQWLQTGMDVCQK